MRKVSWILLVVLVALTLLGSLASAQLAYSDRAYPIGGTSIVDIAQGREAVLLGLRAVRGTSAAYAAAFALLVLFVVVGPYRRGEKWAWWALLAAYVLLTVVALLRIPLIGVQAGVGTALTQLAVVVVALLLDVRRLTASAT